MRPKSIGGSGSVMKSPISASALSRLRRRERHLRRVVLDRVDDLAEAQQADLAAAPVDLGADVVFLAVFRAPGLLDGLLHRLQHFVLVDALVAGDRVGDLQQFGAGVGGGALHVRSRDVSSAVVRVDRAVSASGRACAGPARAVRRSGRALPGRSRRAAGAPRRLSAASRTCRPSRPSTRPRNRLRPSIGLASSIRASNPAKRS